MLTFFVVAFVALPLAIALVVLIFRSRSFFFNLAVVVGLVMSIWGIYQVAIYFFVPAIEAAPTHVPASVGPCLEWAPPLGREVRERRCSL
jgi:hypothetical protein